MWAVYRRLCSVMQGGDLHRRNRAQMLLANLRNATQNLFYRVIQGERSIIFLGGGDSSGQCVKKVHIKMCLILNGY